MTKAIHGGILAIVAGVLMLIPAIAAATPIHVAPRWPGGGLNGSEAARNARHEAHSQQQSSITDHSEQGESDEVLFDALFDGLPGTAAPPITLPLEHIDGTLPGAAQFPPVFETGGVPNPFGGQFLPETALNLRDSSELTSAANPAVLTAVPEPGSLLLLASGIAGAMVKVRRQRRNR